MGIQRLIAKRAKETFIELEKWISKDDWLTMRAVAAGVAEPALLKGEQNAKSALQLHKKIFAQILSTKNNRRSEEFKTLKQGLGFSLSVVVCAIPKQGVEYMHQLIDSQHPDVLSVIKENLKKNRLVKGFPDEVASMSRELQN